MKSYIFLWVMLVIHLLIVIILFLNFCSVIKVKNEIQIPSFCKPAHDYLSVALHPGEILSRREFCPRGILSGGVSEVVTGG